jgi:hypothetical protein
MLERGRKPGDLILFQTVLLPGLGVARMAHPGTILFLAKQGASPGDWSILGENSRWKVLYFQWVFA